MIAATPWMRRSVPGWRKKYELPVMIVAIQPIQSYISTLRALGVADELLALKSTDGEEAPWRRRK
jgi:hypothetical protein